MVSPFVMSGTLWGVPFRSAVEFFGVVSPFVMSGSTAAGRTSQ